MSTVILAAAPDHLPGRWAMVGVTIVVLVSLAVVVVVCVNEIRSPSRTVRLGRWIIASSGLGALAALLGILALGRSHWMAAGISAGALLVGIGLLVVGALASFGVIEDATRPARAVAWGLLSCVLAVVVGIVMSSAPVEPHASWDERVYMPAWVMLAAAPLIAGGARAAELQSRTYSELLDYLAGYVFFAFLFLGAFGPQFLHERVALWQGFVPGVLGIVLWSAWRISPRGRGAAAQRRADSRARTQAKAGRAVAMFMATTRFGTQTRHSMDWIMRDASSSQPAPGATQMPQSPARPLTAIERSAAVRRAITFGLIPATVPLVMVALSMIGLHTPVSRWSLSFICAMAAGVLAAPVLAAGRRRYVMRALAPAETPFLIVALTLVPAMPLFIALEAKAFATGELLAALGLALYLLVFGGLSVLFASEEIWDLRHPEEAQAINERVRLAHQTPSESKTAESLLEASEVPVEVGKTVVESAVESVQRANPKATGAIARMLDDLF